MTLPRGKFKEIFKTYYGKAKNILVNNFILFSSPSVEDFTILREKIYEIFPKEPEVTNITKIRTLFECN